MIVMIKKRAGLYNTLHASKELPPAGHILSNGELMHPMQYTLTLEATQLV